MSRAVRKAKSQPAAVSPLRRVLLERQVRRAAKGLEKGRISEAHYSAITVAAIQELEGQMPRHSAPSLAGTKIDAMEWYVMAEEPEYQGLGPVAGAVMQLLKDAPVTGAQRVNAEGSPVLLWTVKTDLFLKRSHWALNRTFSLQRDVNEWIEGHKHVFPALHSTLVAFMSGVFGGLLVLLLSQACS